MSILNPVKAVGPYLTRALRRRQNRLLPKEERAPRNTLGNFLLALQKSIPGARVHNEGYRGGARVLYEVVQLDGGPGKGGRLIASFRHPTKRATPGRMNFVTVTA